MDIQDRELAAPFMALFKGLERAYGIYTTNTIEEAGKKFDGKGRTLSKPVTIDIWKNHLEGAARIGIVPISDDFKCYFGAIDFDQYDLDVEKKARDIAALGFPLCVCRSKSGGIHAYLFLSEPVSAELVQQRLTEWSSVIGSAAGKRENEIFPKQTMLFKDKGDTGNWINMPYFGGSNTTTYGLDQNGLPLGAKEFLDYAEGRKVNADFLAAQTGIKKVPQAFEGGPPCLNTIAAHGIVEGARNITMFAVAVYLYKVDKLNWRVPMMEYNKKYFSPPLDWDEVEGICDSIERKNSYAYQCSQAPLVTHCDRGKCHNRKYGVQAVHGNITIKNLSKFTSDPVKWFADTSNGLRIELTTEELQDQKAYQRRLMDVASTMPAPLKGPQWREAMDELIRDAQITEAPVEATSNGRLWSFIEDFCLSSTQAKIRDQIASHKVWLENGFYYFTMRAITRKLDRDRIREFKPHNIAHLIMSRGGRSETINIKGMLVDVFLVKEFAKRKVIDTPDVRPKDVI